MSLGRAKFEISSELFKLDDLDAREISDIWDGATNSEINGGYGHDLDYWKRAHALSTEAFADMFAATIYRGNELRQIIKYFPKSYKIFTEIIGEYIKEREHSG